MTVAHAHTGIFDAETICCAALVCMTALSTPFDLRVRCFHSKTEDVGGYHISNQTLLIPEKHFTGNNQKNSKCFDDAFSLSPAQNCGGNNVHVVVRLKPPATSAE